MVCLLGGLLLLLLLLATIITSFLRSGSGITGALLSGCGLLFLLLLLTASGDEEGAHGLSVKEAIVVDLELTEDVVDFSGGEFVSPFGQSPPEELVEVMF